MKKRRKKRAGPNPTVDDQSVINELAIGLAKQWFSSGWKLRQLNPDYFVDYQLERVEGGEPSGKIIYLQQKAHRVVKVINDFASESFDKKHLRYYSEKRDGPIFLLLVDVLTPCAYFLFLQQWIDENLSSKCLEGLGKKTVKVPLANRVDDLPMFLTAVQRSLAYMREKYPGSLQAAAAKDAQRVAQIDPRFNVKVDFVGGQKHYTFDPKENVSFTLKVKGEKIKLFKELYEYGRPLDTSSEDIHIEGSPLFAALNSGDGLQQIAFSSQKNLEVRWELTFPDGNNSIHLSIPGRFTTGSAGYLFVGDLKGAPLRAEITFPHVSSPQVGSAPVQFHWNLANWCSKPIDELPHFDELHALNRCFVSGGTINHGFNCDGRKFFRGTFNFPAGNCGLATDEFDFISAAQVAAKKFGVKPILPELGKLTVHEVENVRIIRDLAVFGAYSKSGFGIALEGTFVEIKNPAIILAELKKESFNYRSLRHSQRGNIFGTLIDLGTLEFVLAPARFSVADDVKTALELGKSEPVPMMVVGVGEATLSISLA